MKIILDAELYDRGTAAAPEDGLWSKFPIVGVWDGVSAPYNDEHPPFLYKGLTGGKMAGDALADSLQSATVEDLESILVDANRKIGDVQIEAGMNLVDASTLGGVTFVLAQLGTESIKIVHGGDCYALWAKKSGEVGISHNSFLPFEMELRNKVAELMERTGGNRKEMWRLFYPFLCQKKRENTNVPGRCALLNGQPKVVRCWSKYSIPSKDISLLILLTDGLVPAHEAGNEPELARKLVSLYEKGRLVEILAWARRSEGAIADRTHETFSEATGLAIRFE